MLATVLNSSLKPQGTLVLTSFALGMVERAYLEAVMDLDLQYRTTSELEALTEDFAYDLEETVSVTHDDSGHVAYLTVVRG